MFFEYKEIQGLKVVTGYSSTERNNTVFVEVAEDFDLENVLLNYKLVESELVELTEEEKESIADKTNNLPTDKERITQLEEENKTIKATNAALAENLYALAEVMEIIVTGGTEIAN